MKTRKTLLLLSAIAISLTIFISNNSVNSTSVIESKVLIDEQVFIEKNITIDPDIAKPNNDIKIQRFPILSGNTYKQVSSLKFHAENFFSKLHGLQVQEQQVQEQKAQVRQTKSVTPKLVKKKIKQNIIRISNMPVNRGFLSSHFGIRKDPFHGTARMHKGVDIAAKEGSTVNPLGKGKIIYAGHKAGYGNMVEIQHSKTVVTRYAHLKKKLVDVGQQVTIEDEIGLVGQTGRSTGPHLHLEVLFNGEQADPQVYLANHFGSRSKTQVAFVERKTKTIVADSVIESVTESVDKRVDTKPTVIAKAEPKLKRVVIAKAKVIAKQKPAAKTMTIQVANNESKQVSDYPQVSYQDYVNSVDGMFGLTAPDSFSQ